MTKNRSSEILADEEEKFFLDFFKHVFSETEGMLHKFVGWTPLCKHDLNI